MDNDHVSFQVEDAIATVTLSNPAMRNALSLEMVEGIKEAIAEAEASEARCVVIEGEADSFCAGGDIQSMLQALSGDADLEALVDEAGMPVNETVLHVYDCSLPTLAKVDGAAWGAGASLAIACDLVIASERAELSFGFQRIGLSIDSGTSYLLPRMVGEKTANDLVLRDNVLDAEDAAELGLVQEVFPTDEFDERARTVIEDIASGPTVALKRSKSLLQSGLDRSIDEAIHHEVEGIKEVIQTEDFHEGVTAFLEQRSPAFEGM